MTAFWPISESAHSRSYDKSICHMSCRTGWFLFTFSCPLALTDVNFRMASRFLPRKKLKSHGTMSRGKMVMVVGSYLRAHIQAVGIDLDTRKARCNTSVQNMAEYTAVISSWLTSVALRTVDALSTAGLLWQSTRNTHTDLSLCPMTILPSHCVDASYCTFHRVWTLLIWIGFCCMTVHLCILVLDDKSWCTSIVMRVIFILSDGLLMFIVWWTVYFIYLLMPDYWFDILYLMTASGSIVSCGI